MAGMLHDMGKAAMPLEVLNKPALTEAEYQIAKTHPAARLRGCCGRAARWRSGARRDAAPPRAPDGRGYPHGLAAMR